MICAVCFGDPASNITQGYNYGILSLLAIIAIVLMAFAALFYNVYKRSRTAIPYGSHGIK